MVLLITLLFLAFLAVPLSACSEAPVPAGESEDPFANPLQNIDKPTTIIADPDSPLPVENFWEETDPEPEPEGEAPATVIEE